MDTDRTDAGRPLDDDEVTPLVEPAGGDEQPAPSRSGQRRLLVAGGALIVATAALAASTVYAVHTFGASAPVSAASNRDAAVAAARTVGATMTTVRGGDPDGTLKAWRDVITGALADQYTKQEPQLKQRIQQSTSSVNSTVTNASLTQFNDAAGTAAALVFVDTTLVEPKAPAPTATPSPAPPAPSASGAPPSAAPPAPSASGSAPSAAPTPDPQKQRLALTMSLNRTDQGWKASDLTPVDPK
ncbi:MAG: hypothetical protein ABI251_15440, partial [Mycobacteriaceae bacterium]